MYHKKTGWVVFFVGVFLCFLDDCAGYTKAPKADLTFINTEQDFFVTSIIPNRGPRVGGTRVTISGAGFNVNFFTAGNSVFIGSDSTDWVEVRRWWRGWNISCRHN